MVSNEGVARFRSPKAPSTTATTTMPEHQCHIHRSKRFVSFLLKLEKGVGVGYFYLEVIRCCKSWWFLGFVYGFREVG